MNLRLCFLLFYGLFRKLLEVMGRPMGIFITSCFQGIEQGEEWFLHLILFSLVKVTF